MLLVDSNEAGVQVAQKGQGAGCSGDRLRPADRGCLTTTSPFDNFHVGELEGQMIVDGLKAEDKDPATAKVVYVGGDPTDGNAKQFHDGADKVHVRSGHQAGFRDTGHLGREEGSDLLRAGVHRRPRATSTPFGSRTTSARPV
jgi:D-xylose transport system substrate-binding protein